MLNRFAIFVIVFVMFMGSVFYILQSQNYHINLHAKDITATHHTYKIYNTWLDSVRGKDPIKSCSVPIMSNGNYPGNPSKHQMKQWMNMCSYDLLLFTINRI